MWANRAEQASNRNTPRTFKIGEFVETNGIDRDHPNRMVVGKIVSIQNWLGDHKSATIEFMVDDNEATRIASFNDLHYKYVRPIHTPTYTIKAHYVYTKEVPISHLHHTTSVYPDFRHDYLSVKSGDLLQMRKRIGVVRKPEPLEIFNKEEIWPNLRASVISVTEEGNETVRVELQLTQLPPGLNGNIVRTFCIYDITDERDSIKMHGGGADGKFFIVAPKSKLEQWFIKV